MGLQMVGYKETEIQENLVLQKVTDGGIALIGYVDVEEDGKKSNTFCDESTLEKTEHLREYDTGQP